MLSYAPDIGYNVPGLPVILILAYRDADFFCAGSDKFYRSGGVEHRARQFFPIPDHILAQIALIYILVRVVYIPVPEEDALRSRIEKIVVCKVTYHRRVQQDDPVFCSRDGDLVQTGHIV